MKKYSRHPLNEKDGIGLIMPISDAIEENDEKLVEFAVGGLCNATLGRYLSLQR